MVQVHCLETGTTSPGRLRYHTGSTSGLAVFCCPDQPTTLGLGPGLCSMQRPSLLLQGTLTRAVRPQKLVPPSSGPGRKNVMLFQVLLHSTIHYHAHQSAACQRQLHAVDMRHARTDARTATRTPRALSGLGCAAEDLVALCVIVARTRCDDPSMTLRRS